MLVFVYGTLRKGQGNNGWLEDSPLVAEYTTPPIYKMVSLGAFPAVLLGGHDIVKGELYDVSPEVAQRLDILEGYPDLYNRRIILTEHGNAWMYYMRDDVKGAPVLAGGDWVEYVKELRDANTRAVRY